MPNKPLAEPSLRLLTPDDYIEMPWANGLGTTIELTRRDNSDGTLLWRCSIAEIREPSAFSLFPGVSRTLMLLSGKGLVFETSGVAPVELRWPGESVDFSGDVPSGAREVFGPSRDFNVMSQMGRFRVATSLVASPRQFRCRPNGLVLVYVESGSWRAEVATQITDIGIGQMVCIEPSRHCFVALSGVGLAVIVQLEPASLSTR